MNWWNKLTGNANAPSRSQTALTKLYGSGDEMPPKDIQWLLENNKEYVKNRDPEIFDSIGKGQSPNYLWIGCSDSRADANALLGLDLGQLFVHRNIANQALGSDPSCMSVIQFSINYLKIPHIIVCGHYDCGGVRAALNRFNHQPPLENWVRNIRDVYRLHRAEIDALATLEEKQRRLVELNVVEQCINLYKTDVVQQKRLETANNPDNPYSLPRIHALVFEPADGSLKELPVNLEELSEGLGEVYGLFDPPKEKSVA